MLFSRSSSRASTGYRRAAPTRQGREKVRVDPNNFAVRRAARPRGSPWRADGAAGMGRRSRTLSPRRHERWGRGPETAGVPVLSQRAALPAPPTHAPPAPTAPGALLGPRPQAPARVPDDKVAALSPARARRPPQARPPGRARRGPPGPRAVAADPGLVDGGAEPVVAPGPTEEPPPHGLARGVGRPRGPAIRVRSRTPRGRSDAPAPPRPSGAWEPYGWTVHSSPARRPPPQAGWERPFLSGVQDPRVEKDRGAGTGRPGLALVTEP